MDITPQKGFATKAIHAGPSNKSLGDPLITPIVTSTIFRFDSVRPVKGYEYARVGNPTRSALEACLAALEDAKYGLTFPSGQSATLAITHIFKKHDHILVSKDLFPGTESQMTSLREMRDIDVEYFDAMDLDAFRRALKPNTAAVWLESPTNPILNVVDIKAIADIAHKYKDKILVVIDNTFLTCYFQRPLDLGADITMYSMTKFMHGHSDVLMGAIVTNLPDIYGQLKHKQNILGLIPSPFDCYLVHRSLKTLSIRMEKHHENSLRVAKFLQKHPAIEKVIHPGLPDNPQYNITLKQTSGHSGIIAFYLKGATDEVKKFASKLKYIALAGSLGGVESTIIFPYQMLFNRLTHEEKTSLGITESFARLSVGIEDADELINDLDQALNSISANSTSKL